MPEIERIEVEKAKSLVDRDEADLVCAYDDQEKCEKIRLDGALTFPEFRDRVDEMDESRTLIFYCA
jgi:hypothetical protein